jgi:uncharacterized membrane protein
MTKSEFLSVLKKKLSALPRKEREERLSFYIEMIEDRMEEGLSEGEAVAAVGDPGKLADQILAEYFPDPKPQRGPGKGLQILLLILGFPLWFPLLIAGFAVALSLYVSVWSVLISFWALFVSLLVSGIALVLAAVLMIVWGQVVPGIAVLGAGLICAGLSIPAFMGCKAATGGTLLLTRKFLNRIVTRKEAIR